MSKKELVANRQYTDEFKVEAVSLAQAIGHSAVEPVELEGSRAQAAAESRFMAA